MQKIKPAADTSKSVLINMDLLCQVLEEIPLSRCIGRPQ